MDQRSLPRYVCKYERKDGTPVYRFNPPADLLEAGQLKRETLGTDLRSVLPKAKVLNKKVDELREAQPVLRKLTKSSTVRFLVDCYYNTHSFKGLRDNTKKEYTYYLERICSYIGERRLNNLKVSSCKILYEQWLNTHGVHGANHMLSMTSIVFNLSVEMDVLMRNPFSFVKRSSAKPRKQVWTHEQLDLFLSTAYTKFDWRCVGLITQMAYAWCQRVGDMRNLKWTNIDFDKQVVRIEQSKRKAEVFLPIDDDLFEMIKQQENDFGFQEWVAPRPKPVQREFVPYTMFGLSHTARDVMNEAGLPKELRISDLRRTGVVELVEAGVDTFSIMSVTGHNNPTSVKPYLKHTLRSATNALEKRRR